jgi:hypothetical protein
MTTLTVNTRSNWTSTRQRSTDSAMKSWGSRRINIILSCLLLLTTSPSPLLKMMMKMTTSKTSKIILWSSFQTHLRHWLEAFLWTLPTLSRLNFLLCSCFQRTLRNLSLRKIKCEQKSWVFGHQRSTPSRFPLLTLSKKETALFLWEALQGR